MRALTRERQADVRKSPRHLIRPPSHKRHHPKLTQTSDSSHPQPPRPRPQAPDQHTYPATARTRTNYMSNSEKSADQAKIALTPETMSTTAGDAERAGRGRTVSLWNYLMTDVDSKETTGPLAAYCFMTGYMYVSSCPAHEKIYNRSCAPIRSDVVSFSAIFVWCGFQTGNFAQVRLLHVVLVSVY